MSKIHTERFWAAMNLVGLLYFVQRMHDSRVAESGLQVFAFLAYWALAIALAYLVLDYLVKEIKSDV